MNEENMSIRERFDAEKAPIAFHELQKHFAKGILVKVCNGFDLVDVAMKMHEDDSKTIKKWIEAGQIVRVHDEHAQQWLAEDRILLAVTSAPWVLVQELARAEK